MCNHLWLAALGLLPQPCPRLQVCSQLAAEQGKLSELAKELASAHAHRAAQEEAATQQVSELQQQLQAVRGQADASADGLSQAQEQGRLLEARLAEAAAAAEQERGRLQAEVAQLNAALQVGFKVHVAAMVTGILKLRWRHPCSACSLQSCTACLPWRHPCLLGLPCCVVGRLYVVHC